MSTIQSRPDPRRGRRVVVLAAEGLAEGGTQGGHTGSLTAAAGAAATAVRSGPDYRLWLLLDRPAANSPQGRSPPILVLVINNGTEGDYAMMHRFFAATGRFAVRFRWAVVAAWVVATVLANLFFLR